MEDRHPAYLGERAPGPFFKHNRLGNCLVLKARSDTSLGQRPRTPPASWKSA